MGLHAATLRIVGNGWKVAATPAHPVGIVFSGGYDADSNTLYLAGVAGHPGGVVAAGGDPSKDCVSGLRVFQRNDGAVFWADDSMSLPRRLNAGELAAIQKGLEGYFQGNAVTKVERLEDIPT